MCVRVAPSYACPTHSLPLPGRSYQQRYRVFYHMTIFNLRTAADIQSRQAMERTLQSQIDGVLEAMKDLVSHNLPHSTVETSDAIQARPLQARSEHLKKFNQAAQRALQQRNLRYEEWKGYKPRSASPAGGLFRAKPKSPPAPTGSDVVSAYGRAGERRTPLLI
jgi:hypothetical protein